MRSMLLYWMPVSRMYEDEGHILVGRHRCALGDVSGGRYINLDLRMGARAKLRRWAASQRCEPVPDWLKCRCPELFDDPCYCRFEDCRRHRGLARAHGASPFTQAPARPTDLARIGGAGRGG